MDHRRRRKRKPSLEGRVMRAFEEAARPLLPAELLQIMQGEPDQAEAINALLEQLVNQGKLVSLKGGRIGLPEKMNLVTGELSVHPDGFGFVTPETGGRDIYLTALNLKEAWHGDRVVVRIEGTRGSRKEGKVIRVLERRHKEVLGLLCQAENTYYVEPEDEHLIFNLVIPPEQLARRRPRRHGAGGGEQLSHRSPEPPGDHPRGPGLGGRRRGPDPAGHPEIRPAG